MFPAQQRLDGHDPAVAGPRNGLVDHTELVVFQTLLDIRFERAPLVVFQPQAGIEAQGLFELVGFGAVHGQVGIVDELGEGLHRVGPRPVDADRSADLEMAPLDLERLRKTGGEGARDGQGVGGLHLSDQGTGKLVAADPGDVRPVGGGAGEPAGHPADDLVARPVPGLVVDGLEAVEIDVDDGRLAAGRGGGGRLAFDEAGKAQPVRQPAQRIGRRCLDGPLFVAFRATAQGAGPADEKLGPGQKDRDIGKERQEEDAQCVDARSCGGPDQLDQGMAGRIPDRHGAAGDGLAGRHQGQILDKEARLQLVDEPVVEGGSDHDDGIRQRVGRRPVVILPHDGHGREIGLFAEAEHVCGDMLALFVGVREIGTQGCDVGNGQQPPERAFAAVAVPGIGAGIVRARHDHEVEAQMVGEGRCHALAEHIHIARFQAFACDRPPAIVGDPYLVVADGVPDTRGQQLAVRAGGAAVERTDEEIDDENRRDQADQRRHINVASQLAVECALHRVLPVCCTDREQAGRKR